MDTKIPDYKTIISILDELKNADLENVSYEKVYSKVFSEIMIIPAISISLPEELPIYRSRISHNEDLFCSEKDISFRTDTLNITSFGRANMPFQSIFYGTTISEEVIAPSIMNFLEISEILDRPPSNGDIYYLTVGKWNVAKSFKVVNISFGDEVLKVRTDLREVFDNYINGYEKKYPTYSKILIELIRFYSNEFSKKNITTHNDYKISVAYVNAIAELKMKMHDEFRGITYPSVKGNYKTNNIALHPRVVESFLKLEKAAVFKVIVIDDLLYFENHAYCEEFGPLNSSFKWKYFTKEEKNIIFSF